MIKNVVFSFATIIISNGCNYSYQCIHPMGIDNGIVVCKDVKILKRYK